MSAEFRNAIEEICFEPEGIFDPKQVTLTQEACAGDLKRKIFSCDLCGIKVTSGNVLRRHKEGRKHIMRLEREGKTFECVVCEVVANSQSQLDAHLRSSRHKNRLYKIENAHEMLNYKGLFIIIIIVACMFAAFLFVFRK